VFGLNYGIEKKKNEQSRTKKMESEVKKK